MSPANCATYSRALRPGVTLVTGSPVAVAARTADLHQGDVVVTIDLRRYDRAVLDAVSAAADMGATVVAITDSVLSPLARAGGTLRSSWPRRAPARSTATSVLAIGNAFVAGLAARLRHSATERIDGVEEAWQATGAVVDRP